MKMQIEARRGEAVKARAQSSCPVCREKVPQAQIQAVTNILWLDRERSSISIKQSVATADAR